MSQPRIAIIVLVLVAVLFAGFIVLGAAPHDDKDTTGGPVPFLKGLLVRQASIQDLSPDRAGCIQNGLLTVPPGSTCQFGIATSFFSVRKLSLTAAQPGSSPQLRVLQPGSPEVDKKTLASGESADFYAYKKDSALEVSCPLFSPPCTLRLN